MSRAATHPDPNLWESFKQKSIQEAVIRLMCREGLDSVTMERVAQEVGIAKGTIYLHYKTKQEMLDAVKEASLAPLMTKIDEILRSRKSADKKLRNFALRYLTYFDEKRDLFRILLYEREQVRVLGSRYQTERYRHLLEAVTRVMRDGIREGIFRDLDTKHLAAMFIEGTVAILNQRLLADRNVPVEEDAELIADVFLRGITT